MDAVAIAVALATSGVLTLFCWRRILRSNDHRFLKIALFISAAVPIMGPVFYFFSDSPPRHIRPVYRKKDAAALPPSRSKFLRRWNEREHIYLSWAGIVFVSLAVLAWWINSWSPGRIHFGVFGAFTDVDAIFFGLLMLAVLTFGGALRAKLWIDRRLREAASNTALESRRSASAAQLSR